MTTGRFIPAGAGNTFRNAKEALGVTVYPRWRGEHSVHALLDPAAYGLSPLARGTPSGNVPGSTGRRFIPAGAGNTRSPHARHFIRAVYPRWRGEHTLAAAQADIANGLSPLARGTLYDNGQFFAPGRFIPAGAGNTSYTLLASEERSVYPRWRGEHARLRDEKPIWAGLSPLARGTPIDTLQPWWPARFIPAGAGNTQL